MDLDCINDRAPDDGQIITQAEATTMNIKFTGPNPAAMHDAQKQLFGAYEEASRAWLARMQSEVDLWTGLAAKLTATRSVPEAVAAYQECVTQRMKMAAEDGQ
jgi:hypothetical protein